MRMRGVNILAKITQKKPAKNQTRAGHVGEKAGVEEELTLADYLQKLIVENPAIAGKAACKDNILMLGESLIHSFGIDFSNPAADPDFGSGYRKAGEFLEKVCKTFDDPTHFVKVAPFAYSYLGPEMFIQITDLIIERSRAKPGERNMLDELYTATCLVKPELRKTLLEAVRKAPVLDNQFFGLAAFVTGTDPDANFTTPDEFPKEFHTSDVKQAADMLGVYLQLGVFKPAIGFTESYGKLLMKMKTFEYIFKKPSLEKILVIVPHKAGQEITPHLGRDIKGNFEVTPNYDARPGNDGENPGIVIVNQATPIKEVQKLYKRSTIVYLATSPEEKKEISSTLAEGGAGDDSLLIDASKTNAGETTGLINAHTRFIRKQSKEKGTSSLKAMLDDELAEAREMLKNGNEFFYDLKDSFEQMGRRQMIDDLVKQGGFRLPVRTDYSLVMLFANKKNELLPFFEGNTRKKLKEYTELPLLEETGMPFVIITNKPISQADLLKKYPSATVIYFALDDSNEKAISQANKNAHDAHKAAKRGAEQDGAFILNANQIDRAMRHHKDQESIGHYVADTYFERINKERTKGMTSMAGIARKISDEVKEQRDKVLFSKNIMDFYKEARNYYALQEKYKATPMLLQLTDGVLMTVCPTGGCLKLTEPETGGCCGGGNVPDVLIDFAIAYRRQVGDKRFLDELTAHNHGKPKEPWYFDSRKYTNKFGRMDELKERANKRAHEKTATAGDDMTF